MGRPTLLLLLAALLATTSTVSAKLNSNAADIEEELRSASNSRGFTCTLTGSAGQDQCDAAADDDGSKCVWCVLNSIGVCVSETQVNKVVLCFSCWFWLFLA